MRGYWLVLGLMVVAAAAPILACDVFEGSSGGGGGKTIIEKTDTGCGTVWVECEYEHRVDPSPIACEGLTGIEYAACVADDAAKTNGGLADCGREGECDDWKAAYYDCLAAAQQDLVDCLLMEGSDPDECNAAAQTAQDACD